MRPSSLRAFVALVPLIGALNGCATARDVDVWVSQSEPRTWAAHSLETVGATVVSDVVTGSPWWGYAFMMGAQVGWEIQEARLTNWDVPWWGTAMDLIAPAVTGFAVGWWLDSRKDKNPGAEPVFEPEDGQAVDPLDRDPANADGAGSSDAEASDAGTGDATGASARNANHLFPVSSSALWSTKAPLGSSLFER